MSKREAERCQYQWSVVAYEGAPSVLAYKQCRKRTTDLSGCCYVHRDGDGNCMRGRWDRRVSRSF